MIVFQSIIIFSLAFVLIFVINELIYRIFGVTAEYTRKSVHVFSGLLTLLLPFFFENHFPVLILTVEFVLMLIISIKFNFFKCINNVSRKTYGSFLFPVSVYLTFFFSIEFEDNALFYIPILILSLSDPLAAISGKISKRNNNIVKNDAKTVTGSLFFGFSAFIISLIMINYFYEIDLVYILILSLIISILSAIVERKSNMGTDNLTIPVVVLLILVVFKFIDIVN